MGSTYQKILQEIAIMKRCRHPHIVRLLEVIDDKIYKKIYMIMEFLGGGEIKWRDKDGNPLLRVDQSRRIIRDVVLGLEYLHHQGIIHRDIKPANLMWTSDRRTVKITDFGVAHSSWAQRLAESGEENAHRDSTDHLFDDSELAKTAGTPSFLAPEVVWNGSSVSESTTPSSGAHLSPSPRPPITKAIDVWALGVTLYYLLFGEIPFRADSEWALYQVIATEDWTVPETMGLDRIPTGGRHPTPGPNGKLSEGGVVVSFLERLLEKNASKRITLDEVKVRVVHLFSTIYRIP
ncbi:kinase-like protein [Stereum hirsutum FP-91666 SS1]|uniref:kinase-like protein n=1 Tax=Stereum hirsutum (strain FP-91666) TaxID=721885 RepID=UPI000440A17D|nr:kinase-like protein [Stereum hirsutum FP-91666 SS1]EIM91581.1 kinase-like protein [Stereum hirsutum FP-91666 SS1]